MQWHSGDVQQESPEDGHTERERGDNRHAFDTSGMGAKHHLTPQIAGRSQQRDAEHRRHRNGGTDRGRGAGEGRHRNGDPEVCLVTAHTRAQVARI